MGESQFSLQDNHIEFDRLKVFDVMNASSSFFLEFKPSWRFALGLSREYSGADNVEPYILFNSGASLISSSDYLLNLSLSFRPRLQEVSNQFQLPAGINFIAQKSGDNYQLGLETSFYRNFDLKNYEFMLEPYYRHLINNKIEIFFQSSFISSQTDHSVGMTFFY